MPHHEPMDEMGRSSPAGASAERVVWGGWAAAASGCRRLALNRAVSAYLDRGDSIVAVPDTAAVVGRATLLLIGGGRGCRC